MKNIRRLCGDLAERLELPEETLPGTLRLTALDDRRLLIENHRGLLAYGTEEIRVSTARGRVTVRGSDLAMRAMDRMALLIAGRLQSIEWE